MNEREEFLLYFQSAFAKMVDRIPAMTETEVLDGLRELQAARNIYHEELVERFKTMTEAEAPGGEVKAAPSTTSLGFFVPSFIRKSQQDFSNSIDRLRSLLGATARTGGSPPSLFDTLEDALNQRLDTLRRNSA
ncbi:MAG TPA: hypothetical protein VKL40_18435 [Candidatus Angelobacter sp.]|nr:hypothetical protein [Candidatus Angelobacter sp.]